MTPYSRRPILNGGVGDLDNWSSAWAGPMVQHLNTTTSLDKQSPHTLRGARISPILLKTGVTQIHQV